LFKVSKEDAENIPEGHIFYLQVTIIIEKIKDNLQPLLRTDYTFKHNHVNKNGGGFTTVPDPCLGFAQA